MEKFQLNADLRSSEENVKHLREQRVIPAVVYGHKQEPISIKLDNSELLRTYRKAGKNHIIELKIGKNTIEVLVHEVQFHPVSGEFQHMDFIALVAGEKVTAHIPLVFEWNSKAQSEGALIEEQMREIEVKAEAKNLIDNIVIDISVLENIGDHVLVSDLKVPNTIEVVTNPESVVVSANKTRAQVEDEDTPTEEVEEENTEEK